MNINYATGRLVTDPKAFNGGVVTFTLAVDDGKDKDGNKLTQFLPYKAFGKTAEIVQNYCHKGTKILVEGRTRNNNYEKDGKKVYTIDLVANRIEFLESRSTAVEGEAAKPAETAVSPEDSFVLLDEDMPF